MIQLLGCGIHALRRLGDEVDATIPKPFDIDRLFEILAEMCAQHRTR